MPDNPVRRNCSAEFLTKLNALDRKHGEWIYPWVLGWLSYDIDPRTLQLAVDEVERVASAVLELGDSTPPPARVSPLDG